LTPERTVGTDQVLAGSGVSTTGRFWVSTEGWRRGSGTGAAKGKGPGWCPSLSSGPTDKSVEPPVVLESHVSVGRSRGLAAPAAPWTWSIDGARAAGSASGSAGHATGGVDIARLTARGRRAGPALPGLGGEDPESAHPREPVPGSLFGSETSRRRSSSTSRSSVLARRAIKPAYIRLSAEDCAFRPSWTPGSDHRERRDRIIVNAEIGSS